MLFVSDYSSVFNHTVVTCLCVKEEKINKEKNHLLLLLFEKINVDLVHLGRLLIQSTAV